MSETTINLLYGYNRVEGGVLAMGLHLAKSMMAVDENLSCRIIKIGKPDVKVVDGVFICSVEERRFREYLIPHSSIVMNLADLYLYTPSRSRWGKINEQIFASEVPIVIHDAKCFTLDHRGHSMPDCNYVLCRVAVYEYMVQRLYKAKLVPYPYIADYDIPATSNRPRNAVCHTRIAPEKGIETILQANAKLAKNKRVELIGACNMMFVNFRLRKSFPNWKDSYVKIPYLYDFPLHYTQPILYDTLARSNFCVDLTNLPYSGSSVQYTFLEAMTAHCHLVVNKKWIQDPGDMIPFLNCTTVDSPEELAETMERKPIGFNYRYILEKYSPKITVPQWLEVIHGRT